MDLEKLSAAPWVMGPYGWIDCIPPGSVPLLHEKVDKEFVCLARNAFEVMMRRGWNPSLKSIGVWVVETQAGTWVYRRERDGGDGSRVEAADPFTALVEADRWYKENVKP